MRTLKCSLIIIIIIVIIIILIAYEFRSISVPIFLAVAQGWALSFLYNDPWQKPVVFVVFRTSV